MIGRVQYNGSLGSIRLHQHTQSSGEAGYSGNRIIRRVNSMPNIFHRSGITNSQKKIAGARRIEKRSVNQQTSTNQPYKYVLGPAKNQPSVWGLQKNNLCPLYLIYQDGALKRISLLSEETLCMDLG